MQHDQKQLQGEHLQGFLFQCGTCSLAHVREWLLGPLA